MQVILVYLQPFCRNSVLKCALHAKKCEKFTKNLFWGIHGCSRSSMLINLKSMSLVLVMINSMFVLICNRLHATRDNCGKITNF